MTLHSGEIGSVAFLPTGTVRFGASGRVPADKAERLVSVRSRDLRRGSGQWARRADRSCNRCSEPKGPGSGRARGIEAGKWLEFLFCFSSPLAGGESPMAGSLGDYWWAGAFRTVFAVDPSRGLCAVLMANENIYPVPRWFQLFRTLVHQTLVQ